MTAAEMHAMELAALDDPFLADAMEGYEGQPAGALAEDMDELNRRLHQRVTPAKVVQMRPQRPWMAIAAASVVLVGLAMTLWYTNHTPEPSAIAKTETTFKETTPAPVAQDSQAAISPAPQASAPVAAAPRKEKPDVSGTTTQVEANRQKDSTAGLIAAAPEPAREKAALTEKADDKRVVTGYASKDARSAAPVAAPPMSKSKKEAPTGRIYTEPTDGWSAWEVYLQNNLRRPKEPVIHGNVVVSFTVNPDNGKPFDLKVDKSLHPLYDKEAIRLIKEGPSWTVYNTDGPVKTTYTVVF